MLLESFSSLWQLYSKSFPGWGLSLFLSTADAKNKQTNKQTKKKTNPGWGLSLLSSTAGAQMVTLSEILLYCSVHQALKEPPSLGTFSIGQLPAPTCGENEAIVMVPPAVHDSVVSSHLHGCLDFFQGHFLLQSPPSCSLRLSPQNQQQSLPWD